MDYWWILLVLVFIAGIFISGYYPALALLNRKPITLLKGKFLHSKSGDRTRQVLVVVQYTASMILLCVTLIVFAQLNFMRNQSLGVKTSQTLVVKFPGHTEGQNIKLEAMKKQSRVFLWSIGLLFPVPCRAKKWPHSFPIVAPMTL